MEPNSLSLTDMHGSQHNLWICFQHSDGTVKRIIIIILLGDKYYSVRKFGIIWIINKSQTSTIQ